MIDITKPVTTAKGQRVIGLQRVPCNSEGRKVTYPLKGSVVVCEKPFRTEYNVWTDSGVWDVVWNRHPELNLIQGG